MRHIAAAIVACATIAACRTGVPVLDTGSTPPAVMGTVTGTVSGPDGKLPIGNRKVAVINLETSERFETRTSNEGGFTVKVPPGKYRTEVELIGGESVIDDQGTFTVSRSELQHDVDIRLGVKRVIQRFYQPPLPTAAPAA